jgi:protein-histidine pros-kinase
VDAAPHTLIEHYGNANGFGWQLGDVVGAQIVSVPFEVPVQHARAVLKSFIYLQVGLFLILFVIVNCFLVILVEGPVGIFRKSGAALPQEMEVGT